MFNKILAQIFILIPTFVFAHEMSETEARSILKAMNIEVGSIICFDKVEL